MHEALPTLSLLSSTESCRLCSGESASPSKNRSNVLRFGPPCFRCVGMLGQSSSRCASSLNSGWLTFCVCRRLHVKQKEGGKGIMALVLISAGIHPKGEVTCQLWICSKTKQNSRFKAFSARFGDIDGMSRGLGLLEWAKAVDPTLGYLTEQHLTLGVHLQVQHEVWIRDT